MTVSIRRLLFLAGLCPLASAVTMKLYQPAADVDAGFETFLQTLYEETEKPASTTTFTDFFTENGTLIVRGITAVGADEIVAMKQRLLPTDGSKQWNHVPNATTIYEDATDSRTYLVEGVIQATYTGVNCSQAYYSTHFKVAKSSGGEVELAVRSGSLSLYDDFIIDPSQSPTHIPCQTV